MKEQIEICFLMTDETVCLKKQETVTFVPWKPNIEINLKYQFNRFLWKREKKEQDNEDIRGYYRNR